LAQTIKILIISDGPEASSLIETEKLGLGYEVVISTSDESSLKIIDDTVDLIVLDKEIPEKAWGDIVTRMRTNACSSRIPVILLGAGKEAGDKMKAFEVECDDFISRPVDKDELSVRISMHLRKKAAQDKMEKSYHDLKALDKTKEDLINILVHDLNNPLSTIFGGIQIVQMEGEEHFTERQRNNLQLSLLAAKDLRKMISNVSDIGGLEDGSLRGDREPVNLGGLTKEVVNEKRLIAQYDEKTISIEVADKMPVFSGDKNLIGRVMTNLVDNAIRFTPPHGSVTIEVIYKKQEDCFYVQVSDEGEFLAEEHLNRVFDKFVQVETKKQVKRNGGLGLTFCKMIVELYGGKIWATNKPGKGTCFAFMLPRDTDKKDGKDGE